VSWAKTSDLGEVVASVRRRVRKATGTALSWIIGDNSGRVRFGVENGKHCSDRDLSLGLGGGTHRTAREDVAKRAVKAKGGQRRVERCRPFVKHGAGKRRVRLGLEWFRRGVTYLSDCIYGLVSRPCTLQLRVALSLR